MLSPFQSPQQLVGRHLQWVYGVWELLGSRSVARNTHLRRQVRMKAALLSVLEVYAILSTAQTLSSVHVCVLISVPV